MRILFVTHHELVADSGAAGSTLALGSELSRLGHTVTYFSYDDLPSRLRGPSRDLLFPAFAARAIGSAIKRDKVDVVDAAEGDATLWAEVRRLRGCGPLLVARSHGLEHLDHAARMEEVA